MPLIGDQQDEDRVQIADLVLSRMNQTVPRTPSSSAVRTSAGQQTQVLKLHMHSVQRTPLLFQAFQYHNLCGKIYLSLYSSGDVCVSLRKVILSIL